MTNKIGTVLRAVSFLLAMAAGAAAADEAQVAVAANFASPARRLAENFMQRTGHRLVISSGSTGKFYAQIRNGAPFDVLLSADDETPRRMEQENLAVKDSRFTYALGKLVLWSAKPGTVDNGGEILRKAAFKRIAIANPRLAPYGAAAQQTMERLGVWVPLQGRLVQGENIAQAFQFVSSGNAELGFVALSQVLEEERRGSGGSYWLVPQSLHSPIRQDAVLLSRGEGNPAARALLGYLRSAPARDLIRTYGYDLP